MRTEIKKGRKLGEASSNILLSLIHAGAKSAVEIVAQLIETHNYDEFVRKRLYKQIYNLERYGYLEQAGKGKENISFFHLTPKGKLQALKHLHLEKILKKKWDGRWRVIIFDIPEEKRDLRNSVRNQLKNMAFYPLQESVYVTPYPVTDELDYLLDKTGTRKYCRYLTVTEIDGESELKREFEISN